MSNFPFPPEPEEAEEAPLMHSGSATDCTGLIPAVMRSDSELDSYEELYDFLPPFIPNADTGMQ